VGEPRGDRLDALWYLLGTLGTGAIILGGYAAAFGWRPAAWILVAVVAATVAGHVLIAAIRYRRTMRRPWPRVEPLSDDDWD
jgi:hypothetical protein